MEKLVVVTPPASLPVTIDEAFSFANLHEGEEQSEVQWLIEAARDFIEGTTGRTLINTVYDWILPEWRDPFELPKVPIVPNVAGGYSSVTSIQYIDADGNAQYWRLDTGNTILVADDHRAHLYRHPDVTFPSTYVRPDAVTIRFTAGYGATAASVPDRCKLAVLMLVNHLWVNRDSVLAGMAVNKVPGTVDMVIRHLRTHWVAGVA